MPGAGFICRLLIYIAGAISITSAVGGGCRVLYEANAVLYDTSISLYIILGFPGPGESVSFDTL